MDTKEAIDDITERLSAIEDHIVLDSMSWTEEHVRLLQDQLVFKQRIRIEFEVYVKSDKGRSQTKKQ